jgi:hypothetical protein
MKTNHPLLSCPFPHAFRHKGGGGGTPPAAVPPVSRQSTEVGDAERQARLAAQKKQGMKSTLLAGATEQPSQPMGGKSLLG